MPLTLERKNKREWGYSPYYTETDNWLVFDPIVDVKTLKIPRYCRFGSKETLTNPFEQEPILSLRSNIRIVFEERDFELLLPLALKDIVRELEDSRYLLELEEDWDDEGAMQIDFETWKRAVTFIVNYALWLLEKQYCVLATPQISPGPNSSIDLLWRNNNYRLLVNISENQEKPIEYYGDNNQGENSIKGTLKSDVVQEFFALWLKNLKE